MPQALAAPAPGYRPRSSTNAFKQIVEDHLDELVRSWDDRFRARFGPLHPRVQELLERFVRCGDLHFAACAAERPSRVRLRCVNPDCTKKQERVVPYS